MKTLYTLENLPTFWERSLPMDNAFILALMIGIIGFVIGFVTGAEWLKNDLKECKDLVNENLNFIDEVHKLKKENESMKNEINETLKFLKNE
jgi:hypothetical protein